MKSKESTAPEKNKKYRRFGPRFYLDDPRQKEAAYYMDSNKGSLNIYLTEAILFYERHSDMKESQEMLAEQIVNQILSKLKSPLALFEVEENVDDSENLILGGLEAFQ